LFYVFNLVDRLIGREKEAEIDLKKPAGDLVDRRPL